jgi:hypothetical protein
VEGDQGVSAVKEQIEPVMNQQGLELVYCRDLTLFMVELEKILHDKRSLLEIQETLFPLSPFIPCIPLFREVSPGQSLIACSM